MPRGREVKRRRRDAEHAGGRDWVEEFEPRRSGTHNRFDSLLRDEDGRRNRRERINEGEKERGGVRKTETKRE